MPEPPDLEPQSPPEAEPGEQADQDRPAGGNGQAEQPMVVGIGASAGGVTALRAFFETVPAESGIAFVVVIHLSPEHESHLPEVLQATVSIPVEQVTARVPLEADRIYVIPPNKNLVLTDGHLDLTEFDEPRGQRAPIDVFFRTLAACHPDGVGIILSGSGTDGAVGMKAIKEHGGVLMAQVPEEAEYDSMPRSAIATGLVDFVLPAADMVDKLREIRRGDSRLRLAEDPDDLRDGEEATLGRILTQLRARSGHDFSSYKSSTVLRRVHRRMRVAGLADLHAYLQFLRANAGESDALLKDLLISVTSFFRDPESWETLEKKVIPALFEGEDLERGVRVWVPGCATGEEAFSVAMLLLECNARREVPRTIQVFASDLDDDAIARARAGLYPEAIATDVSEERLRRFFVQEGGYFRVRKELRDVVLFTPHSVLRDPPFSRLDLITCRNLLIYLERDLQEKVFELFGYALRPQGFLFLGSSESADAAEDLFHALDKEHRIYRRDPHAAGGTRCLPDLPLSVAVRPAPGFRTAVSPARLRAASNGDEHRRALETYGPPSVLLNRAYEIVHVSESASRYLRFPSGSPSADAIKVIRKELREELRAVLFQVLEKGKASLSEPIPLQIDGERRLVQLYGRPTRVEDATPLALVTFIETDVANHATEQSTASVATADSRQRRLEEELDALRQRLLATNEVSETQQEELRASNEELQSINEEYRSTLEELETSKEELQSINEELHTVNEELKEKVDALGRANDDLVNLMDATDVATLFLDRELRIERYTPTLARLFNVQPQDRGRPLAHVTHSLDYPDLADDAAQVLEGLVPVERQVSDAERRCYLTRVRPYRTSEDRIEGVVLTFVDVTRLKAAQAELHRSEQRHRLLVESVKEYAIFMVDEEGRIETWNAGAKHIFGYRAEEILGQPVSVIFTPEDREAGMPERERKTARREGQAPDERWHIRKDGQRFWGSGIMTALYDDDGAFHCFAKVLRDNTQRRKAAQALRASEERLRALNETLEERVRSRTVELTRLSERVRDLASDMLLAEQRERHRIALFLHDDLQQILYAVQIKGAFIAEQARKAGLAEILEETEMAGTYLADAAERMRQLVLDLSPPILEDEDLPEALHWLALHMRKLHDLRIRIDAEPGGRRLEEGMRVLFFQIARELLFNIAKHAGTSEATVELFYGPDRVAMHVIDEGQGFAPEAALAHRASFGLHSIRERVQLFGGQVEIASRIGSGTRVSVIIPVGPAAEALGGNGEQEQRPSAAEQPPDGKAPGKV
jgi:two-component system, chemotaxis family, CheB/CheR fusion protein